MRLVFVGQSNPDATGDPLGSAIFTDGKPLDESAFLAIGETPERLELFDGSLHVTPAPTPRHQRISFKLAAAFENAATGSEMNVLEAVNVRLRPDRIPIPDLVVTSEIDLDELFIDAAAVLLVCEIVSPSNAATDKVLKMHYYAAAGIPWYLVVEQSNATLRLFRLDGEEYVEEARAGAGEALELTEPVAVTLYPQELLPGQ